MLPKVYEYLRMQERAVEFMVSWRMAKSNNIRTAEAVRQLKEMLDSADTVIIGTGAGLSASAGFQYRGERFHRYFYDFEKKYHIRDMYVGASFNYPTMEEYWAYWSRYAYINRYMDAPKPLYRELYELVKNREFFAITTSANQALRKGGFPEDHLLYLQGDFGRMQCIKPCCQETYPNEELLRAMLEAQGCRFAENGDLILPEADALKMTVPMDLHPICPHCGRPMRVNLRTDDTFVKGRGWKEAEDRYMKFLREHRERKVLFLELGVGFRMPVAIKYNFWYMAQEWPDASYACVNLREAYAPDEIPRSVCIREDIGETLRMLAEDVHS